MSLEQHFGFLEGTPESGAAGGERVDTLPFQNPLAYMGVFLLIVGAFLTKVAFVETRIKRYLNDESVVVAQDSAFGTGRAGLRCAEGTVADFDDFIVQAWAVP